MITIPGQTIALPIARRCAAAGTGLLLLLVVAGCTPSGGPTWTYSPALPAASAGLSAAPTPTVGPPGPAVDTGGTFVSEEPCPESRFTCVTLSVARDHFAAGGPRWEVTYAIQEASGTRLGTFVTITGGPGSSGIASADGYTDYYPASVPEHYDIVFLDQRGVGLSQPIQCPAAAAAYYVGTERATDPSQAAAVGTAAKSFVTGCMAESGADEADLPFYATRQAIQDLEAVRQYLGEDQLALYGESYGTQYVQAYAAAYPEHVAALFLDGPVDLTVDALAYYEESARAFNDALVKTLDACTVDEACASDVKGGDALDVYDALAARLLADPIDFAFPMADGTTETRALTLTDLETAASGYVYSETGRELLQRAIAAASRENYVPLARLAYDAIVIDPDSLEAIPDPTYSDAMYYAVECQDYAFLPDAGDSNARLNAWMADGAAAGVNDLRLGSVYYGDLPCLYWPAQPTSAARPAPITDPPYPTFVMTSDIDPATPIANAMRIYARLTNAYFLVRTGGPHVIFGWGNDCPDLVIGDFLATGRPPATRITVCDGEIADPYVALPAAAADDYADGLSIASSIDDHVFATDDYVYRLDANPLPIGCDFGGTLTYTPTDVGVDLAFEACAFTPNLPLTGSGTADDEAGLFVMDLTLSNGSIHYERDADGNRSITGP